MNEQELKDALVGTGFEFHQMSAERWVLINADDRVGRLFVWMTEGGGCRLKDPDKKSIGFHSFRTAANAVLRFAKAGEGPQIVGEVQIEEAPEPEPEPVPVIEEEFDFDFE